MHPHTAGGKAFPTSLAAPTVPPGLPPRARRLIAVHGELWADFLSLADDVADDADETPTESWSAFYVAFTRLKRLGFPFADAFAEAVESRTAALMLLSDDEADPAELDADLEDDGRGRPLATGPAMNAAWNLINRVDELSAADLRRQREQADRLIGGER